MKLLYLLICSLFACSCADKKAKVRNFNMQIGTYLLDIKRTNLGVYNKDTTLYKQLLIFFKSDSTFYLNMNVPFIYDSVGKWSVAGAYIEDWNILYFKRNNKISDQFTSPWSEDSIFYINSATPREGNELIQKIYFRKISR
jgi:hypothetical protein